MTGKRVEYQKFLRAKFEQKRYRELFGLTDNIELRSEEDIVLQREFRLPVRAARRQASTFHCKKRTRQSRLRGFLTISKNTTSWICLDFYLEVKSRL